MSYDVGSLLITRGACTIEIEPKGEIDVGAGSIAVVIGVKHTGLHSLGREYVLVTPSPYAAISLWRKCEIDDTFECFRWVVEL